MIDKVELEIDKYMIFMCLFGIWADVHEEALTAKIFSFTSGVYSFMILISIVLIIVKAYYDFKLNRMQK